MESRENKFNKVLTCNVLSRALCFGQYLDTVYTEQLDNYSSVKENSTGKHWKNLRSF